jgi:predicted metal-dependent phosphoesterase TrpH
MKCDIPYCKKDKPNHGNAKWCNYHAEIFKKRGAGRWASENKKYHYEYLKKWRAGLKEMEGKK